MALSQVDLTGLEHCPEPIALATGADELDHAVAAKRDVGGSEDGFEAVITELADGEERAIAKVWKDLGASRFERKLG
jgi:hypothetical protein